MSSTILSGSPSAASSAPAATTTAASSGGTGPNSPLLFFVALGFGVVFTNLWIIVGVKYCFRYNARNRQRMMGEDPDGVDLGQMPQRRRRREKKLMSIDEVNEKFPLIKYKTWRSTRAEQGLSTAGGITSASRPASLRDVPIASTDHIEHTQKEEDTLVVDEKEALKKQDAQDAAKTDPVADTNVKELATTETLPAPPPPVAMPHGQPTRIATRDTDADGEGDEDDHIESAVPAEQLPDPGDTCAICIDTLEDDDDVRGLVCGHAFHASCVDPWLTSRRACCPLCKADYYVPKPRPEGAEAEDPRRRGTRGDDPTQWTFPQNGRRAGGTGQAGPGGRRPTMVLPGRFMSIVYDDQSRHGFPRVVREPRPSRAERRAQLIRDRQNGTLNTPTAATGAPENNPAVPEITNADQTVQAPSWRQRLRFQNPLSRGSNAPPAQQQQPNGAPETVTPAQLEAGQATR